MRADIAQLKFIDPKLRAILIGMEVAYRVEFTITSLYRENDLGVHGTIPVRGADLSCKNDHLGYMIEKDLNELYTYDPVRPDRKVCMYHDAGTGGKHLHVQVHPNTQTK